MEEHVCILLPVLDRDVCRFGIRSGLIVGGKKKRPTVFGRSFIVSYYFEDEGTLKEVSSLNTVSSEIVPKCRLSVLFVRLSPNTK